MKTRQKIVAMLLAILMTGSISAMAAKAEGTPVQLMLGDLNNDGKIGIKDVLLLQKHLAGIISLTPIQKYLSNVNEDSGVALNDVLEIQKHIAQMDTGGTVGRIVDSEMEQLRSDFLAYLQSIGQDYGSSLDNLVMKAYYGKVKNSEILYMVTELNDPLFPPIMEWHEAGGYRISLAPFPYGIIHAGGTFMSIEEAYEQGYFTQDDVYKFGCVVDETFKLRYPSPLS